MNVLRAKIAYLGYIRHIVGNKKEEEINLEEGLTVQDLLVLLGKKYGGRFRNSIQISDDKLKSSVIVLINGRNINQVDGLNTKLNREVEVQIVVMSPLGGG
jgi:MoaD family protein